MNYSITRLCAVVATSAFLMLSCSEEGKQSQLTIKMKDAPGEFQEVNVELLSVEVHHRKKGWIALSTNQGIYDLLTLQYNVSAVLVENSSFPSGEVDNIRLILGSNNTVKVDDDYHALQTPSAEESGLKIHINASLDPNENYELLIDFDAKKSIVHHGNGDYSLKPAITLAEMVEL